VALASTGPTAQAGLDKAWPSTTFATAQLITVGYPTLAYSDALAFSSLSASSVEGSICQREAEGHARIQHNAPNTKGAQLARQRPKILFLPCLNCNMLTLVLCSCHNGDPDTFPCSEK
jgi:hypothetical protein